MFGSGTATLIISNEEMNAIIKMIKSIEESGLLIKDVSETVKKSKKTKRKISWNVMRRFRCYFIRISISK